MNDTHGGGGGRAALRRWLREPVIHFAVLGAAIYGLHGWLAPPGASDDREIVVPAAYLPLASRQWQRRTGRLPDARQREALVDRYVERQLLYREAQALGLDEGDVIVQRRLVQKMRFLLEERSPAFEPSEVELGQYLRQHAERYAHPARVALTHVFFSAARSGEAQREQPRQRALDVLEELRRRPRSSALASKLGDAFMVGHRLSLQSEKEVAKQFGADFARHVMQLAPERWSGPIRSAYGTHLVWIERRAPRRTAQLSEVRDRVRLDLVRQRRRLALTRQIDNLRRRYVVRVERAEQTAGDAELALGTVR